ncbi:MAG: thermonuclease family protein [Anaerolineaceae bacterium]|nr:thermonuclease family protein [Anaerolineaceae bacterium]
MSNQKRNSKGCWYWILIGWWFEPVKWFFIGIYLLSKWFFTHLPGWIEKTTEFVENNLEKSGKQYSHKKIKTFVSLGFLLLITFSCFGMGAMARSAPEIEPVSHLADLPTNTATFLVLQKTEVDFTPTSIFTPTLLISPTSIITPTVTLPSSSLGIGCVPITTLRQTGKVTKVVDGDTIHVDIDGIEYIVRYIGVDSPESGSAIASSATNYNAQLVSGKNVTLVKDVSETDRYDRLLRYVFVGNTFVNYELVTRGFASSGTWEPDTACDSTFANAMATARTNQLGMWASRATELPATSIPATILPVATLPTQTQTPSLDSNCDPSYPDFCIPSPPPDLDCKDVLPHKRFKVLPPDPHRFDGDGNGIGCES